MPKLNYATSGSINDAIYQLARVANGLNNLSLLRVDFLEKNIDRELGKRSSDLNNAFEKVSTTIQSLQGNIDHTSQAQQTKDRMIDCLNLLQAQVQTMYTDQGGFWAGFIECLKYQVADIRRDQHEIRDVLHMIRTDAQILHELTDISEFPQFKRLPPEIRAMIWDFAIPSRILGLTKGCSVYYFEPGLSPPSVAHVCHEARSIAFRRGRLVSIRNSRECPHIDPMYEPDIPRPAWSWYDPSRDYLRLRTQTPVWSPNATILEITECTQFVISGVNSDHTHCYQLLSYLSNPHYFPQLKVVDFVSDTYKHWRLDDHIIEARLFSLDRRNSLSLVVDDEVAKMALIHRITKNHSSVEAKQLVSWLEEDTDKLWSDPRSTDRVRNLKWPHFLDHLHREWILAKSRWYSSGDGDHDISEAQAMPMSKSLPIFRRVKLIERIVKQASVELLLPDSKIWSD